MNIGFVLDSTMKVGTKSLVGSIGINSIEIADFETNKALPVRSGVDLKTNAVEMPQNPLKTSRPLVSRPGFEPGTPALKVRCSTN